MVESFGCCLFGEPYVIENLAWSVEAPSILPYPPPQASSLSPSLTNSNPAIYELFHIIFVIKIIDFLYCCRGCCSVCSGVPVTFLGVVRQAPSTHRQHFDGQSERDP